MVGRMPTQGTIFDKGAGENAYMGAVKTVLRVGPHLIPWRKDQLWLEAAVHCHGIYKTGAMSKGVCLQDTESELYPEAQMVHQGKSPGWGSSDDYHFLNTFSKLISVDVFPDNIIGLSRRL